MTEPLIVNPSGEPVASEDSAKIVDLAGNHVSAGPTVLDAIENESKGTEAIGQKFAINGFIVAAVCSDGVMRQVTFTQKQGSKLARFLKHMHGGALNLAGGPLFLLVRKGPLNTVLKAKPVAGKSETGAIVPASAAPAARPKGFLRRLRERI